MITYRHGFWRWPVAMRRLLFEATFGTKKADDGRRPGVVWNQFWRKPVPKSMPRNNRARHWPGSTNQLIQLAGPGKPSTRAMSPAEAAEAMGEEVLAPGVHGHLFDMPNGIYIPVITADEPSSGDVSRFLDSLPLDRRIVFPTVLSPILRAALYRRGFVDGTEFDPDYQENVEIMVRAPKGK